MAPPVVVCPPTPVDGRRSTARGELLGLSRSSEDLVECLRRTGMPADEVPLSAPGWIEWRGGGPDTWE